MNKKVLAVFLSRTQALSFSRNLNKLGIKNKIINTPRELTTSCGLSIEFEYKYLAKIKADVSLNALSGFYLIDATRGYIRYVKI